MIRVRCRGYAGDLTELESSSSTVVAMDGTMHGDYNVELWPDRATKVRLSNVDGSEIEILSMD